MKSNFVFTGPSIAAAVRSGSKPGTISSAALLVCAALFCTSTLAMAQAGKLDTTFGTAGLFTDSSGIFDETGTTGDVVALQGDGKIIAAGQFGFAAGLVRLNANGTLDSSFGTGGMVTINFPGTNNGPSQVIGVAVQSDGKILAGISNLNSDGNPAFILARLHSDGGLDSTFGTAGVVETVINPPFGVAASVLALQSDGKILLAGESVIARYEATGQLDITFGSRGVATIAAASPTTIALQPDGKILISAGGASLVTLPEPGPGLASPAGTISRYNTNGSIDTSFGILGQVASVAAVSAIAVQTQGGCVSTCKILVAGTGVVVSGSGSAFGFGLVRYNSNGNIDTTFGRNGGVITSFAPAERNASAFAVVLQTNGDVVAAGSVGPPPGAPAQAADFALARYNGGGVLDTTFGSGGKVTTAFGTNLAAIYALALQSDGKIVAVGTSQETPITGQVGGLVVARYLAH